MICSLRASSEKHFLHFIWLLQRWLPLGSNYYNPLPAKYSNYVSTWHWHRQDSGNVKGGMMMCVFTCSHYLHLMLCAALQNNSTVNRPVLKEEFTDQRETKASGCFSLFSCGTQAAWCSIRTLLPAWMEPVCVLGLNQHASDRLISSGDEELHVEMSGGEKWRERRRDTLGEYI